MLLSYSIWASSEVEQASWAVFSGRRWNDSLPRNSTFSTDTINPAVLLLHTVNSNLAEQASADTTETPEPAMLHGSGGTAPAWQNYGLSSHVDTLGITMFQKLRAARSPAKAAHKESTPSHTLHVFYGFYSTPPSNMDMTLKAATPIKALIYLFFFSHLNQSENAEPLLSSCWMCQTSTRAKFSITLPP